jgi:hypothetical protein
MVVVQVEHELLKRLLFVPGKLLTHSVTLLLEVLAQVGGLSVSSSCKLLSRYCCQFASPGVQVRKEFLYVLTCGVKEPTLNYFRGLVWVLDESRVEKIEGFCFGLTGVRLQRAFALRGLDPSRSYGDDFLV